MGINEVICNAKRMVKLYRKHIYIIELYYRHPVHYNKWYYIIVVYGQPFASHDVATITKFYQCSLH